MVINIVGLGISFVGTILVAFSVRRGKVYAWKDDTTERPDYMMQVTLWMFRLGVGMLAVGFLAQVGGMLSQR